MTDFNQIVNREHTGALKLEVLRERYGRSDLLPLWVADMDFATPPFITEALRRRLDHSLYGYTITPPELWPTVSRWIEQHHGWHVPTEWLTFIPGIVKGIGMVLNVFTRPGDKVIIQPPVYHPFRLTPEGNGREVVYNPLREVEGGSYEMDFDNLAAVTDDRCKVLILSNPHNPAGICWDAATLRRLAAFCHERGILVISDEIHGDMALSGHRHVPFASVSDEAAACSITFGAPSKTFNIAGIVSSYAIVPDAALRKCFYGWLQANELDEPTLFAPIATLAAFSPEGEQWRREMLEYVQGNVQYLTDYLSRHLPRIKAWQPQASFLVWLDCRGLGLPHDSLVSLFVDKARLALNDGAMFGPGGAGFMRINVGTPRALLTQALHRLHEAVQSLEK